jgi:hypothetical protein
MRGEKLMRTTILITSLLLLAGCSSKPSPPQPKGGINKYPGNSPIVIADGDSIHFRQSTHWGTVDGVNFFVKLTGYQAWKYNWKSCTVNGGTGEDHHSSGNPCFPDPHASNSGWKDLPAPPWTFKLCWNACPGTTIATVAGPAAGEVDIAIVPAGNFDPEGTTNDGDSLVLGGVNLVHWQLIDSTNTQQDTDALFDPSNPCAANPGKTRCVLKISYCTSLSSCK